jgi:hypothetical protein
MRSDVLRRRLLAAGSALVLSTAARAQAPQPLPTPAPSHDAIGAILDRGAPGDEDEPDTAGQPRTGPEPEAEPAIVPRGPPLPFPPAPRPQQGGPVQIDETGKTPDGPPAVRDLAYDARIRASFASAESFQGPLDGGWTLSAAGQDLYALQLVDRRDRLEGAWRDLRRKGSLDASGLVTDLQRQGPELTLRFTPSPGRPMTVATLHETSGHWTGELAEGSARRAVTLRRTSP